MIDHQQFLRQCFALTSCDLAGCYDRIIHTAAALALLRIGIPHNRIKSMFGAIQKMIHRIKTVYGVSDTFYGGDDLGDWENWAQGILQGNTSGPSVWSTLSSVIFDILHKRGFNSTIISSISKQLFTLVGFAYVDDCDLIQVGDNPITVLESMQALINSWGSLMEVTGGVIRTDKSWWYLVDYVWKRGKWVAHDPDIGIDLVATNIDGERVSLKQLRCDKASEMLGIWLAPNGDKKKLIKELKIAAMEWAGKMRLGHSSPEEAWTALHTNIGAKLKYPLPACTLSEAECKSIMFPAIRAALPKAGIASCISTEFRDGPITSLGAGVLSLFNYMGTSRTACLVDQIGKETQLGVIMKCNIEDLVLDAGLFGSLWTAPVIHISKYVATHSWLYATIKYNSDNDIELSLPHGYLHPQRGNDKAIMQCAIEFFDSVSELRAVNRVRVQKNVVSLADISLSNGSGLDKRFLFSTENIIKRNSYKWPTKHHVTSADYNVWRKLLTWIFPLGNYKLQDRLLKWDDEVNWVDNWDWFTSDSKEFLFHQQDNGHWHRHLILPHSHRSYYSDYLVLFDIPTEELHRASVLEGLSDISLLNISQLTDVEPRAQVNTMVYDAVTLSSPKIDWFMKDIQTSTSTHQLYQSIKEGTALAVSDGSFPPLTKTGTCAWIVSTQNGEEWIQGGGVVPGESHEQNSYRSELGGQLGIAIVTDSIQLPPPINQEKYHITIVCDGLSALDTVGTDKAFIKSARKCFDLISMTSDIWKKSKFTFTKQHVYAHQDDLGGPLAIEATLNCKVDSLAKKFATDHIKSQTSINFQHTTIGLGSILCGGHLISSRLQHSMYKMIMHKKLVSKLSNMMDIPNNTLQDLVHWDSLGQARKEAPLNLKIFITKWISKETATGIVMVQRKKRLHDNCPMCNIAQEDTTHILQCNEENVIALKSELISDLRTWMMDNNTQPDIMEFIASGLSSWLTSSSISPNISPEPQLQLAFHYQRLLGWEALLHGFLTNKIVHCQQQHYTEMKSRKLGTRWGSNITTKFWKIIQQIWIHRNNILHETTAINHLSGMEHLVEAVSLEHNRGLHNLPYVYAPYFLSTLPTLLNKTPKSVKQWFLVIRSGRESVDLQSYSDIFATDPSLRDWIGLSPIP